MNGLTLPELTPLQAGDQRNYAKDDPKLQEERYNEGKTKKGAHSQQDPSMAPLDFSRDVHLADM